MLYYSTLECHSQIVQTAGPFLEEGKIQFDIKLCLQASLFFSFSEIGITYTTLV